MMNYIISIILALTTFSSAYGQGWSELSQENQKSLQSLHTTWESLPIEQRQQWLKKTSELKRMNPSQLKSSQERMAEWASLSEKQRVHIDKRLKNNINNATNRAEMWQSFINQK